MSKTLRANYFQGRLVQAENVSGFDFTIEKDCCDEGRLDRVLASLKSRQVDDRTHSTERMVLSTLITECSTLLAEIKAEQ